MGSLTCIEQRHGRNVGSITLSGAHWRGRLDLIEDNHHPALASLDGCCCCQVTSVVSDSVRPHRWQPTSLPHPWDSPGKNTGMGCHFLLQCMKVKVKSLSRAPLSNPMDCSPPGSSLHGISQARVLEWGAILRSVYLQCCKWQDFYSFWLDNIVHT